MRFGEQWQLFWVAEISSQTLLAAEEQALQGLVLPVVYHDAILVSEPRLLVNNLFFFPHVFEQLFFDCVLEP